MSVTLILQAVLAALQFPGEVVALIKLLQKTPEQNRQDILKKIEAESAALDSGNRPTWEST